MFAKDRVLTVADTSFPFDVLKGPVGTAKGCLRTYLDYRISEDFEQWVEYYTSRRLETSLGLFNGKEEISGTTFLPPRYNSVLHRRIREVRPLYSYHLQTVTGLTTCWRNAQGQDMRYGLADFAYAQRGVRSTEMYTEYPDISDVPLNLSAHAWWSMQPRFESGISLLNSLFELKDFRDVLKHLARLKPWKIEKALKKGIPTPRKLGFDPTRSIATLHLTNELAIKPLIADILNLSKIIFDIVNEKQLEFAVAGTQLQKSHWSDHVEEKNTLVKIGTSSGGLLNLVKGQYNDCLFTATLQYNYKYKCRNVLEAFTAYFGLGLNFNAIWNALPMSFIWDYFNGISESLRNMQTDQNVDLNYTQYCESVKRWYRSGTFLEINPITFPGSAVESVAQFSWDDSSFEPEKGAKYQITGTEALTYARYIKHPYMGPALPRWKFPSNHQMGILAALLRCFL